MKGIKGEMIHVFNKNESVIHASPYFKVQQNKPPQTLFRCSTQFPIPNSNSFTVKTFGTVPKMTLNPYIQGSVGLFGAIEIGYTNGPFLLNRNYHLKGEVICVGQSPQTEYVWYETTATNEDGELVATMRMQGRSMKASSAAYQ